MKIFSQTSVDHDVVRSERALSQTC